MAMMQPWKRLIPLPSVSTGVTAIDGAFALAGSLLREEEPMEKPPEPDTGAGLGSGSGVGVGLSGLYTSSRTVILIFASVLPMILESVYFHFAIK